MKKISIIIPAYNEEKGIIELYNRIKNVIDRIKKYNFEIIIIDNGSVDRTYQILKKIRAKDKRLKLISLSRNFGTQGAQSAAFNLINSDCAILMFADLQDPPELISLFIENWEKGYEDVYGIIQKREGVSYIRKLISPIFYRIMYLLTQGQIPENTTDFRLIDKKIVNVLKYLPEQDKYIRGLVAWTGFSHKGVPYVREKRFASGGGAGGVENLNIFKFSKSMLKFILNAVFSFSTLPLKIISFIGIATSLFSFFIGIYLFLYYLIFGTTNPGYVRGYTSTLLVMLFLFGILFISLGIIGEYIARIYEEVKRRPNYIIKERQGI